MAFNDFRARFGGAPDAIGQFRHVVTFQTGTTEPDGDGGVVDKWIDLDPPTWPVSIKPAAVRDLERETAGTIVAAATHVIIGRYRGDVDVKDRALFQGREFRITGIKNVDERGITMELFAIETVS